MSAGRAPGSCGAEASLGEHEYHERQSLEGKAGPAAAFLSFLIDPVIFGSANHTFWRLYLVTSTIPV